MTVVVVAEAIADRFAIEIPFQVVDDDEIEQAVVVIVGHGQSHAPAFAGESGRLGDVDEFAVFFLVIKRDHGLAAVQIPVIPVYREREIGHILDETSLDAFIVTPQWRGFDYLGLCHDLASARGDSIAVLTVGEVVTDAPQPIARQVPTRQGRDLGATQWIFYTSGTGGMPKGVRHGDGALAAAARGMVEHLAMTSEDRSGIAFPIAHIGGPINLMAGLLAGSTLILIEHDMDVALRVAERVTMMYEGRVIVEGTPDEIRANQTVHDLYLGRGYQPDA